ncbi:MAG: Holliday junction branch migration protein RuvA, partial [Myxococcota bacterium]
ALNAAELASAIQREDRAALKGISGVGKKTVERLFLDLKDKLIVAGAPRAARPAERAKPKAAGPLAVVVGALVQMGYKPAAAERACESLNVEGKDTSALLREALANLA